MRLHVFHPESPEQLAARDALLQSSLRPEPLPFGIAAEYPLVLGLTAVEHSYCFALTQDGELVAHANLLPRVASGGRRIGLVGNVATSERHRGLGIMRSVIEQLARRAADLGLEALLLWSDLLEFYQKLGFQSFASELRFRFSPSGLARTRARPGGFQQEDPPKTERAAAALLMTRYPHGTTLHRTSAEFMHQLSIPATELYVARATSPVDAEPIPTGYLVHGKGYDMAGVVHEWGAVAPAALLSGLLDVAEANGLGQILLLAPAHLRAHWKMALGSAADDISTHPMALLRPLCATATNEEMAKLFVWGLDSI